MVSSQDCGIQKLWRNPEMQRLPKNFFRYHRSRYINDGEGYPPDELAVLRHDVDTPLSCRDILDEGVPAITAIAPADDRIPYGGARHPHARSLIVALPFMQNYRGETRGRENGAVGVGDLARRMMEHGAAGEILRVPWRGFTHEPEAPVSGSNNAVVNTRLLERERQGRDGVGKIQDVENNKNDRDDTRDT